MPSYHVWTVGCQMNKSDSERLATGLEQMGFASCPDPVEADIVVLNTCVVRQAPEDAAAGLLGRLRRARDAGRDQVVVVTGCMVSLKTGELERRFPQVDVWARPQEFAEVLSAVGERVGIDPAGCTGPLVPRSPGACALVPVIHGCDKFCAFCIIPYRRGREASRPIPEVVREVEALASRGAVDVTLLGQNVDSYGHDLEPRRDLADLLYAVHDVPGLARLRFLTSHPNDMSARIIQAAADLPKVCECVSLPFQTGDDEMLASMRRGYTRDAYLEKVAQIRAAIPSVTLTTDLMVGLPGETEAQFLRTVEVLEEVRFDKVHAAAYSERPGTIAARTMTDDVEREEKRRRLRVVSEVQKRIGLEINSALKGMEFEVLVDGESRGRLRGRTRSDKLVYVEGSVPNVGDFVRVRIVGASPYSLEGEVLVPGSDEQPKATEVLTA